MTGIIHLKSGTYAFRTDHHHGDKVWAWEIHSPDYDKSMTHKWDKLPKGHVELFDIEQPPQTETYILIML
jgi:hypothetical protein